ALREGRLTDGTPFDPRQVALVEEGPDEDFAPLARAAQAQIVETRSNRVTVAAESATPAFLVLADVIYPGWQARLDDAPVPLLRTDYVLRGVRVPAGRHRVTFEF